MENMQLFYQVQQDFGDILKAQGYKQMIMLGSIAEFGGRDHLFEQHGNYEIFDYQTAVDEGKRAQSSYIWWGFDDTDLFEYAKEKITLLSEEEQPFNFTMLTADTHAPDGYLCPYCEDTFDKQYYNVLNCSARKVKEFVEWAKEQDFYENTTIIICGDHPSMQPATFDNLNEDEYERTVVDIIINPAIDTETVTIENTKNRGASTMDMLPTTLASLGAKIEGEKLGLGTNLFSSQKTLIEKYGLKYVQEELLKKSKFYDKQFI